MLQDIYVYPNLFIPSAILVYKLSQPAVVRLEIYSDEESQLVRELIFIPGNPGGRQGENKVFWDGCNNFGMRVPFVKYVARFFVDDQEMGDVAIVFKINSRTKSGLASPLVCFMT